MIKMTKVLLKINGILFLVVYMVFTIIAGNVDCYSWSEDVRIAFGVTFFLLAIVATLVFLDEYTQGRG